MKRSAQVALVLMGVTGTTATAAYMMPARPACQPALAASTTVNPPNALAPAAAAEPCRRRSWSGWRWNSYSHSYSSYSSSDGRYSNPRSYWSRRPSSSVSTALTSTGRSGTSTSTSSGSSASRGGFGATGHAVSGGGHSGGGHSGGS
jgi:hypothetical protein